MATEEERKFEKEVDQIEDELGEEHLVQMLQHLTSDSPEASQGLADLHTQCRNVISKYPPMKPETGKSKPKRTLSQDTVKRVDSNLSDARKVKLQTEKPRIMMTKRPNTLMPLNQQKNIAT